MSNTYSGDPASSSRDAVRFWLNDVASPWEFSDQEIDYALTLYPNAVLSAAWLAGRLAMKYAASVDKSVGDLRISNSQKARMYADLQTSLKAQADSTGVTIFVGGISKADMATVDADTDRNAPPFGIKQFDIPGSADAAQIADDDSDGD